MKPDSDAAKAVERKGNVSFKNNWI
jgi:hypothetical protein